MIRNSINTPKGEFIPMSFSNCKKFIFLLTIVSISHIPTSTNSTPISNQLNVVESLLQQAYSLPLRIDRIVERLALLVSKHQISLKNTGAVLSILKDVRMLLNSTLRDRATINTIQDPELQAQIAIAILHLCDSLSVYLDHAIEKNLSSIKPFDISQLTRRRIVTNFSPEKINDTFKFVQNKIELLDKKTDFVGLTWYNKAARRFEKLVIKPCQKYPVKDFNVFTITKLLGLTALASSFIAWRYGNYYIAYTEENPNFISQGIKGMYNKIGSPIPINQQGNKMQPHHEGYKKLAENVGKAGLSDAILTDIMIAVNPQSALLTKFVFGSYISAWIQLKPWLSRKVNRLWNSCLGGAYKKKAVEGIWDWNPTARFKDVVGLDEVKERLSFIIRFIENPEKYLLMNTAPERGILLTGPTRTGKSFIVEALVGEIKDMFEAQNRKSDFKAWKVDSHIIQQYGIADILDTAKSNAPIILFIDEIDLLGLQRVGNNQLLSQFLTSMNTSLDSDPSKQVILIAATNKPETLDKALRQYGRLGKEIRFEYPAFRFRKIYLEREFNNMALDTSQFDLNVLAQKTEEKSFEDLRAIIRSAMILSWTRRQPLSQKLLEESLDTELRHIIMVDRKELPYFEKHILSVHFAGRALAMTLLDTPAALDKVTIKAVMTNLREEAQWEEYMQKNERDKQQKIIHGDIFTKYLHDTIYLSSKEKIVNKIKSLLAGFMAEELLLGSCSYTCHPKNSEQARILIEQLVFEGYDPHKLSKRVYQQLADKVYDLLVQYRHEVKELLAENHDALLAITNTLQERDTLTATEILEIIDEVNSQENAKIEESSGNDVSPETTNDATAELAPSIVAAATED